LFTRKNAEEWHEEDIGEMIFPRYMLKKTFSQPDPSLPPSNNTTNNPPNSPYDHYDVAISPESRNYTVGMVWFVNLSEIFAKIGPLKSKKYFQICLKSISKILSQYDCVVIPKNSYGLCFFLQTQNI